MSADLLNIKGMLGCSFFVNCLLKRRQLVCKAVTFDSVYMFLIFTSDPFIHIDIGKLKNSSSESNFLRQCVRSRVSDG